MAGIGTAGSASSSTGDTSETGTKGTTDRECDTRSGTTEGAARRTEE